MWREEFYLAYQRTYTSFGGILMGIDLDVDDLGAIDERDSYVKFIYLCNKNDCFKWTSTVVYDPSQNDKNNAF
jgi:hypothetical protein